LDKITVFVRGGIRSKLADSLLMNKALIDKIYVFSETESNLDISIPIEVIKANTSVEAFNLVVKNDVSKYLLFLDPNVYFEEDLVEELIEEAEDSSADIVFPNLISVRDGKENVINNVINFEQLYGKEIAVLQTLSLEKWIPGQVLLFKRESIVNGGYFDEELGDYYIHDFIYRNLKKFRIRLSEFSFAYYEEETNDFNDLSNSWKSFVLRNRVLKNYDWEEDIFPFLSWKERPEIAKATALTLIGKKLSEYLDYFNASDYFRKALMNFHNQETLNLLVNAYFTMGLFEKAKELLSPLHGVPREKAEEKKEHIEKVESLIFELEKLAELGRVDELNQIFSSVLKVYCGAPVYNILGFLEWIQGNKEGAYRYFFRATLMNPIDQDYLYNLAKVAKEISREEEVKSLIKNLVADGDSKG